MATGTKTAIKTATTSDTAAAIAGRLRISATRLARTLRREADTGLSPSQLSILATIDTHGAMTLGELATHERVAPPSITKVISKLETAGLVTRSADAGDRRVTRVALTATGATLLRESRRRKDAWLANRLAQLGADDRARLAAALDVLEGLTGP
ncbi:MAG: MarR family transcriptional regulator [Actinobacteria bacterium]|nr:MarR family transcriptional regulator [Actinomycetota bacterium]